jgi:hypothetical protein
LVLGLALLLVGLLTSCSGVGEEETATDINQTSILFQTDTLNVQVTGDPSVVGRQAGFPPGVDIETVVAQRGQLIRWTNSLEVPVFIHLERTPVSPTFLEVPAGGGQGWAVVLTEAPTGTYKYSVSVILESGEVVENDPYIDIPPPPNP